MGNAMPIFNKLSLLDDAVVQENDEQKKGKPIPIEYKDEYTSPIKKLLEEFEKQK